MPKRPFGVLYSTGPMENATKWGELSKKVWVKVLNNSNTEEAEVRIRAFALDGTKTRIDAVTLYVEPQSSDFVVFKVDDVPEFEIQIKINELDGEDRERIEAFVLPSVWGKSKDGDINPAHRVLTEELNMVRPIEEVD